MPRPDPFPRERFGALIGRLPRYARLAWRLGRSPSLSRPRRLALLAGAAYLVSPIDLVPGIIPVAGQLDDAAAVLVALRLALGGLPADERRVALAEAGLAESDMADDMRTIGATYGWLGRQGGRLALRGARSAGRGAWQLGKAVASRLRR